MIPPLSYIGVLCLLTIFGCRNEQASQQTIHVLAASSLTEAFSTLQKRFETQYPHVDVRLTFNGSQVLRIQIEQGLKADVFASATTQHIDDLANSGHIQTRKTFAKNKLAVVISNHISSPPQSITELRALKRIVIGAPETPIGQYTTLLFEHINAAYDEELVTKLKQAVVSKEKNVRLARSKVALGAADGAIVYATDARSDTRLKTLAIPDSINVSAQYEVALLRNHSTAGLEWFRFITSDDAQAILKAHGFEVD